MWIAQATKMIIYSTWRALNLGQKAYRQTFRLVRHVRLWIVSICTTIQLWLLVNALGLKSRRSILDTCLSWLSSTQLWAFFASFFVSSNSVTSARANCGESKWTGFRKWCSGSFSPSRSARQAFKSTGTVKLSTTVKGKVATSRPLSTAVCFLLAC